MIISHSKKFIFIHVYKIAGTSIKGALLKYADGKIPRFKRVLLGVEKNHNFFSSNYEPHITAPELKELLPKRLFGSYFKFAFVRNPYDWQVSLFSYMKEQETHHQHNIVKNMNFKEYLNWRVNEDLNLQSSFLFNEKEQCLVNYIGKIENIQHDFKRILRKINIAELNLGHLNKSSRKNYLNYYDKECYDIVNKGFDNDFRLLNYQKIYD